MVGPADFAVAIFGGTTSPCSVIRMPCALAPGGRARMASKLEPPPPPRHRGPKKRMRTPPAQRTSTRAEPFPVGDAAPSLLLWTNDVTS